MKRILWVVAACALQSVAFADKPKAAAPEWSVDGDWADTCNCAMPCPCWKDEKPSLKHCQDLFFWHITKGSYGAAKLDGLNLVQVAVTADEKKMSQSMGDKDVKIVNFYVPKDITAEQETALKEIFSRLAVAPPDSTKSYHLKKVDIKATVSDAETKVEIPKVLSVLIKSEKKPYPLDTTVAGWTGAGTIGKQVKFEFHDDGQSWSLKDRNAVLAKFSWSSKKGPLPGEPGYQPPPAPAPAPAPAPTKK